MSASICERCRFVSPAPDVCAACGSRQVCPALEPSAAVLQEVAKWRHQANSATNIHGIIAAAIIVGLFVLGSWLERTGHEDIGGLIIISNMFGAYFVVRYLRKGPRKHKFTTGTVTASSIEPALVRASATGESTTGVADALGDLVAAPVTAGDNECLAWSAAAGVVPDAVFVRGGQSTEFIVDAGSQRVVVTGPTWIVPNTRRAHLDPNPNRLGLPFELRVNADLVTTMIRSGDRVRVHGVPATETHRAFSTYREATGPVLRGTSGTPVIIELLD